LQLTYRLCLDLPLECSECALAEEDLPACRLVTQTRREAGHWATRAVVVPSFKSILPRVAWPTAMPAGSPSSYPRLRHVAASSVNRSRIATASLAACGSCSASGTGSKTPFRL